MPLPASLRALLQGNPFGEVVPPRPPPPPQSVDGRTVALEILKEYVTNLDFWLPQARNLPPRRFNIDPANFHIEFPDNVDDLVLPACTIVHDRAPYNVIGLVSYVEEDTYGKFSPGTVVQWQSEYTEDIQLEVWTTYPAERRAIIAGIEQNMSPTEQMSGLRFRMPAYYDELVCFTLNDRELMDGRDSALRRRRAQLGINMRFNVVALVNANTMKPVVKTRLNVDDEGNPLVFEVTAPQPK